MTKKRLKKEQSMTSAFLLLGALSACSHTPEQGTLMNGLTFLNQTNAAITQVSLHVKEGVKHVSCGQIEVQGECGTGFVVQHYHGETLTLRYQGAHGVVTQDIVINTPSDKTQAYKAIIRITHQGSDVSVIKAN